MYSTSTSNSMHEISPFLDIQNDRNYDKSNWQLVFLFGLGLLFYPQGERNLENVTHEEAVATLKSITDKVTLVVGKTNLGLNNTNSIGLTNSNSQSTSAVNSVGQNVVDFARSQSPAAAVNSSSRSHSPRKCICHFYIIIPVFAFYYDKILLLCFRKHFNCLSFQSNRSSELNFFDWFSCTDLESSSRYASSNVLAAVPPGTPRAVSTEDITRYNRFAHETCVQNVDDSHPMKRVFNVQHSKMEFLTRFLSPKQRQILHLLFSGLVAFVCEFLFFLSRSDIGVNRFRSSNARNAIASSVRSRARYSKVISWFSQAHGAWFNRQRVKKRVWVFIQENSIKMKSNERKNVIKWE